MIQVQRFNKVLKLAVILGDLVIKSVMNNYTYEDGLLIEYLQPIITQYFIDNKSEIWLLFLIAHSKR